MLQLEGLSKSFGETRVFHDVSLALAAGEFVALLGESGVGKSTLLNCIAGLEAADAGRVVVAGQDLAVLDEGGRARLRRGHLGFVFQAFHVLPHLTVAENVALPLLLLGRPDAARVAHLLDAVGLGRPGRTLPGAALGRAIAAGGHCTRGGARAAADPGRRAHRQPRPRHRGAGARRAARAGARRRRGLPARHALGRRRARADRMLRLSTSGIVPP